MRDSFILRCTVCAEENYLANKNKRLHPDRVEYKKYCQLNLKDLKLKN